jgi:SAM-dependent methyltransferase
VSDAREGAAFVEAIPEPAENIFGHRQRLYWLRDRISPSDRVLEFGCGTGRYITFPLRAWGYAVEGIDLDQESISHGQRVLSAAGIDPSALTTTPLEDVNGPLDCVIASEVLEHLSDADLSESLALIHSKLGPGGRLLVTVPNGYSEFELENWVWEHLGFGSLYERVRLSRPAERLRRLKEAHTDWSPGDVPMTVADSPHVQRFTWRSIHAKLAAFGFDVKEARGAVLVCGPFSDLLFTGMPRVMRLNTRAGRAAGRFASDFYITAVRR